MKIGYAIVGAQISWIILSLVNSLWVFQYRLHLFPAVVILLGCGLWLKRKEHRVEFRNSVIQYRRNPERSMLDNLSTSIRIGMISIFAFLVVSFEVSKLVISESDGYKFIKAEVARNPAVQEKVGTIQYIALTNNMNVHYSFKAPEQSLETSIFVFGDKGEVKLDASASKKYDSWEMKNLTIGD